MALLHVFFVFCLVWAGLSLLGAAVYSLGEVGVMRELWTMLVVGVWLYGIIVCGEAVVEVVRGIF